MQLIHVLIGLVGSASAVDLYFHHSGDCSGASSVCSNMNPDRCCGVGRRDIYPSVAVRGIPTNWNLNCRGHFGGDCLFIRKSQNSNGANWVCLNDSQGWYSGIGYGFVNKKREPVPAGETGAPQEECVKPDLAILADGAQYNIAGLDEDAYNKFLDIVEANGVSADVPAEFDALRK
ncbi:hypothetical protein V8F33_007037 [Rhypophila sp. PSN 637]